MPPDPVMPNSVPNVLDEELLANKMQEIVSRTQGYVPSHMLFQLLVDTSPVWFALLVALLPSLGSAKTNLKRSFFLNCRAYISTGGELNVSGMTAAELAAGAAKYRSLLAGLEPHAPMPVPLCNMKESSRGGPQAVQRPPVLHSDA